MRLKKWVERTVEVISRGNAREDGNRFDAAETAMFKNQLEHMMEELFDVEYPDLMSKVFFPTDHNTPTGATSFSYKSFDRYGQAKIGGNYSDDAPLVNVDGTEYSGKIVPVRDAYSISVQDIRAAAMAGTPLDTMLADTARHVIEQSIDDLAAFGDADAGLKGFLDHDLIDTVGVVTGTWGTADPLEIIEDVQALWNSIPIATKLKHRPNTLLVPPAKWNELQKIVPNTTVPISSWLIEHLPGLQSLEQWVLLDEAGSGDAPRLMAYERSPRTGRIELPQEFEQFEPQWKNLAYVVNCHARCGGAKVFYPKAFAYMDGI